MNKWDFDVPKARCVEYSLYTILTMNEPTLYVD